VSAPGHLVAGRYRLVSLVGTGGMGAVWEAWDERLQRRVAVKQLRLPPELTDREAELASQRAMREARITARLHHPNAISVFDVVDEDGRPCLIMQFVPSMTLAEVLKEGGPLHPHEAAQVGAQVAAALTAAHELGIVHRDVKPGNILIADDGTALLSDFGISRALDDLTLTTTGMVHGTPAYLAPEVARGEQATFASDLFCLGATLYAALEGSPPFGTDTNAIALLHRVAAGNFEPPRRSGPLTPVLLQLLAEDPAARPPMYAAARMLEELTSGGAASPPSAVGEPGESNDSSEPGARNTEPGSGTRNAERAGDCRIAERTCRCSAGGRAGCRAGCCPDAGRPRREAGRCAAAPVDGDGRSQWRIRKTRSATPASSLGRRPRRRAGCGRDRGSVPAPAVGSGKFPERGPASRRRGVVGRLNSDCRLRADSVERRTQLRAAVGSGQQLGVVAAVSLR
jgi:hypothetical protein